mgnify:CR=1 FL=1
MSILTIILIIVAAFVLYLIFLFNRLVAGKNRVEEAYSDITVQMKRRFDLIPNLIETVKGYAKHESETLEKVINARNTAMAAMSGSNVSNVAEADNALAGTLKSLFALSESYPDLKANQNFLELQRELTDTEDKVMAARRFYNGATRDYNIFIQTFPANLFASMFKFNSKEFFDVENKKEIENPVKVAF